MEKVDLNQIAKSREQVLFALVLVVLIFFLFKMLYTPQTDKMRRFQGQLTALRIEKEALIRFSEATPVLERSSTLSRKRGTKVRILLNDIKPMSSDITELLAQLTDADFRGSITVKDMNYQSPTKENGYVKTDFTMHLLGDFLSFLQYLERLEQFPALFNIESVGIRTIEGRPQELETEITGRFFQWEAKRERGKI